MSRQSSLLVAQRNESLLQRIWELESEHPFWGYRRVWAYLHVVEHQALNKKRIVRLMREHHLLVSPHRQLKAKRTPMRSKPWPTKPNEW